MSLLDKASLIITPNSYKESKLYSVVPNTTLGDMDVVRATTATRVNSAGLIEVVPRNLFTYSEQFENANWLKQLGSSIVSNTTIAPNGTLTADTLNILPSQYFFQNISAIASTTYRISIYVKVASGTKQFKFNTYSGTGNDFTSSVFTATTEWQRFTYSFTAVSNATTGIYPILVDGLVGGSFFIWGAQLDQGSTATEYFPTTTRLNIPRIDYANGSCPSLLVEPQRTNLLTYSNDFSNVSWVKQELTLTANSIISPDGTLNAYKLTPTAVNSPHQLNKLLISAPVSNTMSFYAKKGGYDLVECLDGASGFNGSKFNLNTGTFTNQGTGVGSMFSVGNGWYRCIVTVVTTGIRFYINNSSSYIGDGTSGIYLWGTQFETASYPTSYIPTVASTVTRNADVISKTGISSLIGQTEGTIYAEIKVNKLIGAASRYIFHISDGTVNNRIYIAFSSAASNVLRARIFNGGTLQCSINTSAITTTGTYKLALAYKNNDIVFYVNGIQIGVDTSATIPTCSRVDIGHNYAGASQLGDGITNTNIFKTRLTNTELQSLTTL